MDGAAKAALEAEVLEKQKEAREELSEAGAAAHDLSAKLKAEGREEDAAVVEAIAAKADAAAAGELGSAELGAVIADGKREAAKLRAEGREEEALALEQTVAKLESAKELKQESEAASQE